jgi:GT2 family glycosyltransferase
MKLAIAIPCLNLWNLHTKPCLSSIRTSHPHRIVLVDNGSTDETRTEASRLVSEAFVYRRNESNSGTCKAWNWALWNSFGNGADVVLVLNNDVLLHPECIDRLVARLERRDGRVGMATARDLAREQVSPEALFAMRAADQEKLAEVESGDACAFMLTRGCWESVGAFDEAFYPAYFEDNDYYYRMKLAGLLAITLPTALCFHFGCRTSTEAYAGPMAARQGFLRCREYYIQKWGGPPHAEAFRTPFGSRNVLPQRRTD